MRRVLQAFKKKNIRSVPKNSCDDGTNTETGQMLKVFQSLRRKSNQSVSENSYDDDAEQEQEVPLRLSHIHEEEHEQEVQEVQEAETCPELCMLLQVQPGSDISTSVVGAGCSDCTDSDSGQQNSVCLVQMSVSQQFPKPPEDLNQNLQQHLQNIQNTVVNELTRLAPLLDERLMGHLINCYHRRTVEELDSLLQDIGSAQNHFVLMKWVLKTYLSQELFGHPALQKVDSIKHMDLVLWTQWEADARDKLLKSVQREVRGSLEKILDIDAAHGPCDCEEDYIRVYVDTIQCTNAMHTAAQPISPKLSDYVQGVCFQELLVFAKRYVAEQTEALGSKATIEQPETIHFLKTLKTCKELKQHVQADPAGASSSGEIVETLDQMEAFTLKCLLDIVANTAETHLNKYFRSERKSFPLLPAVQSCFPKRSYGADEQKRVMDEAYKVIVQIYIQQLIKTNKCKLEKCWNPNVSQRVCEDAEGLHSTMSELAPGVEQQHLMWMVMELSDCKCKEALKVTAASVQEELLTISEDPALLPALLRWKGLSKCQVREVMQTIQQDHHPRARSESWSSPVTCW